MRRVCLHTSSLKKKPKQQNFKTFNGTLFLFNTEIEELSKRHKKEKSVHENAL